MIDAGIIACPCGELEGAPSLRIRAAGPQDPYDLLRCVEINERPGLSVIWIESAPWGLAEWDAAIRIVAEAEALSHMAIFAIQSLASTRWSGYPKIQWTVDLTDLLRAPLTESAVATYLEEIAYIPTVREIVAFRPAPINLTPSLLDPLYQYINPEAGGYVYVEAEQVGRTIGALSRCMHTWSQRYWRPEHG